MCFGSDMRRLSQEYAPGARNHLGRAGIGQAVLKGPGKLEKSPRTSGGKISREITFLLTPVLNSPGRNSPGETIQEGPKKRCQNRSKLSAFTSEKQTRICCGKCRAAIDERHLLLVKQLPIMARKGPSA